ncbi:hypothetical protein GO755_13930 [Spirosoma sp. HMF4905]|uniref:Uncharacterized protein n=1 Tax=Spirosoma arboris TaxID=2682092 RepID=A0A7K1SC45_9BACT|nr:hypothetical protein [Spirosoma arboris]MVM31136.1 hypothetical protein [Spirosoma arboris]
MNKLLSFTTCGLLTMASFTNTCSNRIQVAEISAFVSTPDMALWVSAITGKLWLALAQQTVCTTLQILNEEEVLYNTSLDSRQTTISQAFDLSDFGDGTYHVAISIGSQLISKELIITPLSTTRTIQLI